MPIKSICRNKWQNASVFNKKGSEEPLVLLDKTLNQPNHIVTGIF
jgi:hypothetical protein